MSSTETKIAFKLELSRMLELLADQIYQSPLALLRENTQNAFDAIRMRQAIPGQNFDPAIQVSVDDRRVTVSDNGIGMTAKEIETSFWYAGRSGKNTEAARAAGVVGHSASGQWLILASLTNCPWIASRRKIQERTASWVRKSELSTDTKSISVVAKEPRGEPGTIVTALLAPQSRMSIQEARAFLHGFVEFVDVPVTFNGERLSGAAHRSVLPSEKHAWSTSVPNASLAGIVSGDLELLGMASGELRVVLENAVSQAGLESQVGSSCCRAATPFEHYVLDSVSPPSPCNPGTSGAESLTCPF